MGKGKKINGFWEGGKPIRNYFFNLFVSQPDVMPIHFMD